MELGEEASHHNRRLEWEQVPLSSLYYVKYGKANPGLPGEVPVIGSSGAYAWTVKPLILHPTIVVGRKGSAGQAWLVEEPSHPSDTTFYLEPRDVGKVDITFTYFSLRHSQISASDDVIPSLQRHELENLVLLLPPLPEQRAITSVLSKIQAAVEVQGKIVATLKELKAATMAKLFREGLRGEPLKQTEIGKIPESWRAMQLREITKLITKGSSPNWQGFEYRESGVLFVRSQNIGLGELLLSDVTYLPEEFNKKERRSILSPGDILINIVGASIGRAAVADERLQGANINQAVALVRIAPESQNPVFFMYFLISEGGLAQMHRQKKEIARANLSLEDVGSFLVPIPAREEQDKIAEVLESINKRLNVAERKRNLLKFVFSSMLHLLMTGQLRMKGLMDAQGDSFFTKDKTENGVTRK